MLCISLNNLLYQGELPKPNTNTSAPAGRRGVRRRRDPVGRRARHHPAARAGAPVHAIPGNTTRSGVVASHSAACRSLQGAVLRRCAVTRSLGGLRPRSCTTRACWCRCSPPRCTTWCVHGGPLVDATSPFTFRPRCPRMSLTSLRRCTRRCPTSWACPRSPTSPSSARASSTTSTRSTVRGPPARLRAFSTPRK
jgi:hypothetical protein